jgi:hypothetical protein
MHPNAILAAWVEMRNRGQYYIGQLGGPPLHIDDWKKRELERYDAEHIRQATPHHAGRGPRS